MSTPVLSTPGRSSTPKPTHQSPPPRPDPSIKTHLTRGHAAGSPLQRQAEHPPAFSVGAWAEVKSKVRERASAGGVDDDDRSSSIDARQPSHDPPAPPNQTRSQFRLGTRGRSIRFRAAGMGRSKKGAGSIDATQSTHSAAGPPTTQACSLVVALESSREEARGTMRCEGANRRSLPTTTMARRDFCSKTQKQARSSTACRSIHRTSTGGRPDLRVERLNWRRPKQPSGRALF